MQAFRVKKIVPQDGRVELEALPFRAGETVEIIVLAVEPKDNKNISLRPLKGSVLEYINPTEPVALNDWDALRSHS